MKRKRTPPQVAELAVQLEANPEYVARRQEQNRAHAERTARLHAEQAPIVRELQNGGVDIQFLPELIMRREPYPSAIPILLRHLVLRYSDATRETLARALAVPDARHAWPILVAEYRKTPMGEHNELGAKDGLAAALAVTATESVLQELIALAKERSNGDSRLLLLRPIRKSKSLAARKALEELAFDPALAKEIASWDRAIRKQRKN